MSIKKIKQNKYKIFITIILIIFLILSIRFITTDPANNASDVFVNNNVVRMLDGEIYFHDLLSTKHIGSYELTNQSPTEIPGIKKYSYQYKTYFNFSEIFNDSYYIDGEFQDKQITYYMKYNKQWIKIKMRQDKTISTNAYKHKFYDEMYTIARAIYI